MGSHNLQKLSLVAQYDDLCRYTAVLTAGAELEFKTFVESQLNFGRKRQEDEFERRKLDGKITSLQSENGRLETKIKHLKDLLNESLTVRKRIESEKNSLARQIAIIKEVLLADGAVDNHTKEKLAFLSSCKLDINSPTKLATIEESAGSLFSISDIDQTEDDLENPRRSSNRRRRRSQEKRSSSESRASLKKKKLDIEDTESVNSEADSAALKPLGRCNSEPGSSSPEIPPIFQQDHKSSSAQSKYNTYNLRNTRSLSTSTPPRDFSFGNKVSRSHVFVSKTFTNRLKCYPCNRFIAFMKTGLRCENCRISCHPECKSKCPTPCFPIVSTPTKGCSGTIADYTSSSSPMIPPLIVHCINEIESRGLKEVGLYRVSGSEHDVKTLKEKFLRGRSFPYLNNVDIHVICGTIKDFLRFLKEPLISRKSWKAFIDAAEVKDEGESLNALFEVVVDLPQPNRDTLAFLILHLQKVAGSPECKMSIENLARVFGPTVIGYSEQDRPDMLLETTQQYTVMKRLLSIPYDSWQNLLNVESIALVGIIKKTPENTPAPKGTRLGPIYTHRDHQKNKKTSQVTPRSGSKYSKPGRIYFSSPHLQ